MAETSDNEILKTESTTDNVTTKDTVANDENEPGTSKGDNDDILPPGDNTTGETTETSEIVDSTLTDEYHYTKTGEYTSELFKVSVNNIPPRISYGRFRSTITKILGFPPKKVKYNKFNNFAFIAFGNEEQRQKALCQLNEYKWKDNVLVCKKALPAKDPFVRENKRKGDETDNRHKKKPKLTLDTSIPPEQRIVHAVCSYATYDYEEQLRLKQEEMLSCVKTLSNMLRKTHSDYKDFWLKNNKICLELQPIIKSPVLTNYRNKVEFTIGVGPDGKDNTVGFRLGSYREGSMVIVEATNCINCSQTSLSVAKEFQDFIQNLPHPSYNIGNHIGLWQQLTVRTCTSGDVMAIIQINTSYLSKEELENLKFDIENFYKSEDLKTKVTSVYLGLTAQSNSTNVNSYEHICFEKHIHEELLGLKFRISPDAFFQVNTSAAELLYQQVFDWCDKEQDDACVLDICCGTGTIGLCIAKKTSLPVIGIEICQQAIEDAKYNASLNDISNAHFVCGPAEKVLYEEIKKINKKNIIAVVDPPRAGIHKNVISLLRTCAAIKKIIYVSCSARQANDNFLSLCRMTSKRAKGAPFKTKRAIPVDLFPQTPHCELIVELVRVSSEDTKMSANNIIQIEKSKNVEAALIKEESNQNLTIDVANKELKNNPIESAIKEEIISENSDNVISDNKK